LALADIAPASKTVATELSKAKSSNSEDDWIFSIRLAAEIASPGNSHIFGSDPDLQIRNNLASAALLDAVKGGYRFRLFRSFNVRGNYAYSLNVSAPMQEHTFYGVPSSTIRNVALITKVLYYKMQERIKRCFLKQSALFVWTLMVNVAGLSK
jgi:hypothetical protein